MGRRARKKHNASRREPMGNVEIEGRMGVGEVDGNDKSVTVELG
jgi:hypothetical protein